MLPLVYLKVGERLSIEESSVKARLRFTGYSILVFILVKMSHNVSESECGWSHNIVAAQMSQNNESVDKNSYNGL